MIDMNKDDVTILIPTLNEEAAIGSVVAKFKALGFKNILVIDGNSKDRTVEIAKSAGANVMTQIGKGKGTAVIQALKLIKTKYCVLIDGDATYLPEEVDNLLDELDKGADHVIGNRLLERNKGSFTKLNFFGNKMINRFFTTIYGIDAKDITSGYRAFKTDSIKELSLQETGFGIETEMTVESVKMSHKISSVDITYLKRKGKTKLNPFIDGFRIFYILFQLARYHNPLMYFGVFGLLFFLAGFLLGIKIVYDWFSGVPHSLLITLDVLIIMVGIMFFLTGVLGGILINVKRDILRIIRSEKHE
jgi:dolichol-phosphate mannosyltransferase